jgi:hypothetical protein
MLKISVSGEEEEISARGKPITGSRRVMDVMSKFGSKCKYGDSNKVLSESDVVVGVPL